MITRLISNFGTLDQKPNDFSGIAGLVTGFEISKSSPSGSSEQILGLLGFKAYCQKHWLLVINIRRAQNVIVDMKDNEKLTIRKDLQYCSNSTSHSKI